MTKLLAIAGSLRAASFNRMLLKLGIAEAEKAGATVDVFDLKQTVLPIYDQDVQDAGWPPTVMQAIEAVKSADGFLVASPEYNFSMPAGLKNWIDWTSRAPGGIWTGKTVALLSASPGASGGMRMQEHFRQSMAFLQTWVVPMQYVIPKCAEAFDAAGQLKDERLRQGLTKVVGQLIDHVKRMKG